MTGQGSHENLRFHRTKAIILVNINHKPKVSGKTSMSSITIAVQQDRH